MLFVLILLILQWNTGFRISKQTRNSTRKPVPQTTVVYPYVVPQPLLPLVIALL